MPLAAQAPPTPSFLRAIFAIVWKDLRAEFRSFELVSAMLVFSLLVILIFNFALELDIKTRQSVTAGVLWTTFAFAGTLGLNRSMAIERFRPSVPAKAKVVQSTPAVTDWRVLISSSSAKLKMRITSNENTSIADTNSNERNSARRSFHTMAKIARRKD